MSNIAVQGGATGTGTVTILAPSTSTSRTLTLPDSTGTIAAASSGTPDATTFLRGDGAWATAGSPPGTVELLQEDIVTTSGTWTKATGFDADDTVMIFLVGGGASGGAGYVSTGEASAVGGLAGQCVLLVMRYADAPAIASLTAGAGGASVTQSTAGASSGNNGSDTQFVSSPAGEFSAIATGGYSGPTDTNADGGVYPGLTAANLSVVNRLSFFSSGNIPQTLANTPANISSNSISAGVITLQRVSNRGAASNTNDQTGTVTPYVTAPYSGQIFGSGGSAGRNAATNQTVWNPKVPALFNTGGNGSGTANGVSATGIGGGGGGCVRQNATAVSGAGGGGGMVVRYYSGRVSPFQILGAIGV